MSESSRNFNFITPRVFPSTMRLSLSSQSSGGTTNNLAVQTVQTHTKMLSASFSALVGAFVMTPLDVVKTRLQFQQKNCGSIMTAGSLSGSPLFSSGQASASVPSGSAFGSVPGGSTFGSTLSSGSGSVSGSAAPVTRSHVPPKTASAASPVVLRGTLDAFYKIPKYEGVGALWKGLTPTLMMSVPSTVIYLSIYESAKERLGFDYTTDQFNPLIPVIAGSFARSVAAVATCPFEYMKTFLQANSADNKKTGSLRQILGPSNNPTVNCVEGNGTGAVRRGNGVNFMPWIVQFRQVAQIMKTMWTGLGITVMRDGPYAAMYWLGYEFFKHEANEIKKRTTGQGFEKSQIFAVDMLSGLASGCIASSVTNPIDVIKTRIQAKSPAGQQGNNSIRYAVSQVWQTEGYRGFLRGIIPRVVRVAPNSAITVSCYELFKHFTV